MAKPGSSQKRSLERRCRKYADQLAAVRPGNDAHGVLAYLKEHNVSYATAQRYRLGLVDSFVPGDDRFLGMLCIPYCTPSGIVAVKFRRLSGDGPKYDAPTGQKPRLYNAAAYFSAGGVIGLAEGELDAIAATEHVGIPTIGIPGASVWHSQRDVWGQVFKDFARVVLFADGDDAGKEMAKEIGGSLKDRLTVLQCDPGHDVCSTVAAGQTDELKRRLQLATTEEDDD